MLDRQQRPNAKVASDGIARLDVGGIGDFLLEAMARYADHPVRHVVPVAHGAAAAVIVDDALAFAPFDYEQTLPADVLGEYRTLRPPFAETGSPALPNGLNLGAQLLWMERVYPAAMERGTILPWAQYWAWFLSGESVSEATSLGCHTDLWRPEGAQFSSLASSRGWDRSFAPLARAGDAVGPLRPEIAERTGLPGGVTVLAGLHDSNAALLAARGFAEYTDSEATVLSTGTWFVAMRLARDAALGSQLPAGRDCLVNVDAYGQAVPSARFMGGREIETLIGTDPRPVDIGSDQTELLAAVGTVLADQIMVLPTLAPGCGPYPDGTGRWMSLPGSGNERRAAACLYAALVADRSLELIGSKGRLLIEGRFARADVFVRALAALRPAMQVHVASAHNDVSFGAMRLIDPALRPVSKLRRVEPLAADLVAYRTRWRDEIAVPA